MGKQYTIGFIRSEAKEIKGKMVDNMQIKLLSADGKEKWENIPAFNKCFSAAAVCNAGDLVDVTWEKKSVGGKDYFNVTGFTRLGASEDAPAPKQSVIPSAAPKAAYGTKSDDTQLSICRQSSNTAAMNFVIGMLTQGVYPKKSTPEMLFEEVKRFAKKFEAYVTLKEDYGAIESALETVGASGDDEDFDDKPMF
jgi:hypothetical protein